LSVINSPNKLGTACNVAINAVDLGGRMCMLGLPNFDQSVFYTKITADNLCTGNTAAFEFDAHFVPTSLSWDFGDASAASTQPAPTHQYANAGTYTVSVTANYDGGSILRKKEIRITPPPPVVQIPPQV